jgi:hypothetical protein
MRRTSFAPTRRRRSPVGPILLLLVAVILAFLIYLGVTRNEQPLERIEQDVTNDVARR